MAFQLSRIQTARKSAEFHDKLETPDKRMATRQKGDQAAAWSIRACRSHQAKAPIWVAASITLGAAPAS